MSREPEPETLLGLELQVFLSKWRDKLGLDDEVTGELGHDVCSVAELAIECTRNLVFTELGLDE